MRCSKHVLQNRLEISILYRFERLSEDIPVGSLGEKYMRMINTFSQEMDRIAKFFKKQVLHINFHVA